MSIKVIRYECRYCKKVFANKTYADRHERNCYYNPNIRACATCTHKVGRDTKDRGLTIAKTTFDDILENNFETLDFCKIRNCFLAKLTYNCNFYQFNGFSPKVKGGEK